MTPHSFQRDLEGQPLASNNERLSDATYDLEKTHNAISRRQLFYLLIPHAVGAAIIDAVANFALACAMYRTTHKEIRLWPLEKNTIAGDMGVTVIIQGILTMLITSTLVRGDIRAGRIDPFPFPWPRWVHKDGAGWWRYHVERCLCFLSPTETLSLRSGRREFSKSLFMILVRGFVISAFYFFLLWPLAIAITAPLYGGIDMHGTWTPQIIKAVFGGVFGLLMNPVVAALVLGAQPRSSAPPSKRKIASTTQIMPAEKMRQEVVLPVSLAQPQPAHVSPQI